MKCANCGSEMETRERGTVAIKECPSCGGIWFHADDLRRAKDETDPYLNWMDFEIWKHEDEFRIAARPKPCPKCNKNMVLVEYADTGIEVDYCPKCRGVWLDAGEFEKVIQALENEMARKSIGDYWKAALHEAKELITRPEGFVSEWKDFVTVLRLLEYRILTANPRIAEAVDSAQRDNPLQ